MKFSVLISVYIKERPAYLVQALQSLANQILKADEVVLVEDGPIGDDLLAVIEQFKQVLNIKSVKLKQNSGLAIALNVGLKHCTHELVARMDSDDVSLPQRFEKQVAFMQAHPDVAVSSAYIEERNEDMSLVLSVRKLSVLNEEIARFAKHRCPISHPVAIFRKQAVLSVGGYPNIYPEDYPLWSLLLVNGFKFANVPEILVHMRTGEGFLSRRGFKFLQGEIRIFSFQRKIGLISYFEFIRNVLNRSVVRLSPSFIKRLLYKYARN